MFIIEAEKIIKDAMKKDPKAKILIEENYAGINFQGKDYWAYYPALQAVFVAD